MMTAEITFQNYKKKGNPYVRARQYVTLLDGTVYRAEGSGKNRVEARTALQKNIEKRNEFIRTGMKKENGEITLAEAVSDLIKERAKEYEYLPKFQPVPESFQWPYLR